MKIETRPLIGPMALVLSDIGKKFQIQDDAIIKKVTLTVEAGFLANLKVESHCLINGVNVVMVDSKELPIDVIRIEKNT